MFLQKHFFDIFLSIFRWRNLKIFWKFQIFGDFYVIFYWFSIENQGNFQNCQISHWNIVRFSLLLLYSIANLCKFHRATPQHLTTCTIFVEPPRFGTFWANSTFLLWGLHMRHYSSIGHCLLNHRQLSHYPRAGTTRLPTLQDPWSDHRSHGGNALGWCSDITTGTGTVYGQIPGSVSQPGGGGGGGEYDRTLLDYTRRARVPQGSCVEDVRVTSIWCESCVFIRKKMKLFIFTLCIWIQLSQISHFC